MMQTFCFDVSRARIRVYPVQTAPFNDDSTTTMEAADGAPKDPDSSDLEAVHVWCKVNGPKWKAIVSTEPICDCPRSPSAATAKALQWITSRWSTRSFASPTIAVRELRCVLSRVTAQVVESWNDVQQQPTNDSCTASSSSSTLTSNNTLSSSLLSTSSSCPSSSTAVVDMGSCGIVLDHKALQCLAPGVMLHDEVVNAYAYLVWRRCLYERRRVFVFSTHVVPKLKRCGPSGMDKWDSRRERHLRTASTFVIPVHDAKRTHWFLVVVTRRRVEVWDSLRFHRQSTVPIALLLYEFVERRRGWTPPVAHPTVLVRRCPKQDNLVDCGVFMLSFLRHVALKDSKGLSLLSREDLRRRLLARRA